VAHIGKIIKGAQDQKKNVFKFLYILLFFEGALSDFEGAKPPPPQAPCLFEPLSLGSNKNVLDEVQYEY